MLDFLIVLVLMIILVLIPILAVRWLIIYIYRSIKPKVTGNEATDDDGFLEEKQKLERPRVRGVVGLLLFNVLATAFVIFIFSRIDAERLESPVFDTVSLSIAGLSLLLAFVSAILIAQYKRIGLYLGAVYVVLSIISGILLLIAGFVQSICGLVVWLIVAYYLYKYIMIEPDKNFFT